MRPRCQDVVGKLVDQRVRGVDAFAGHRDDDDRYPEQPQQGRNLHRDVDDRRAGMDVGHPLRDERHPVS